MLTVFDGEAPILPVTKNIAPEDLPPARRLLFSVIRLAASDCHRILEASEPPTPREAVEAASACRFFLTPEGEAMMAALGLPSDARHIANRLAQATLERLGLTADDVLNDDAEAWRKALDRHSLINLFRRKPDWSRAEQARLPLMLEAA